MNSRAICTCSGEPISLSKYRHIGCVLRFLTSSSPTQNFKWPTAIAAPSASHIQPCHPYGYKFALIPVLSPPTRPQCLPVPNSVLMPAPLSLPFLPPIPSPTHSPEAFYPWLLEQNPAKSKWALPFL